MNFHYDSARRSWPAPVLLRLLGACLLCAPTSSYAEVISVDTKDNAATSSPTPTFLWKGDRSKATLIMIPGGEGHIGLSPGRTDPGGFYGSTLKPLSDPAITSGIFNVVIFDSPVPLASGPVFPVSRTAPDHLSRIESVVRYYKEKFNKPVWLMGHSNGAVSVTEFYRYLQKDHEEDLVSGIIYSSGRNGARFGPNTNLPVLFLAHEKDGCAKSTNSDSLEAYRELAGNNKRSKYVLLKSGEAEFRDPCRSGYHMFFNAHEEAYKAIDAFASAILE